jgi:pyrroline-5-carboxylate reductase
MVYGNHKVRMSKKMAPAATAEAGTASLFKNGPGFQRLRALMANKGIMYNQVTATSVAQEDPWFLAFKPNSLKANITSLKKEFAQRENVEALRKLFLIIVFI